MTVTAPTAAERPPEPTARHLELAGKLISDRPGLTPHRGIKADQARLALARALARIPPTTDHGRLLAATLRHHDGQRPAPQRAVQHLVRRGLTPSPAAVASLLAGWRERETAEPERRRRRVAAARARRDRIAARVDQDGPRAAATVAGWWREHGHGPTWRELARTMGWSNRQDMEQAIRGLAAAGWLAPGRAPRSLRPGPAAGRQGAAVV